MKSSTAAPSLRNSGLETTSKPISSPRSASTVETASRTRSAVPTGTVDLSTMTRCPFMCPAMVRATESTYCRSAEPSSSDGVPTAMNWKLPWCTPRSASVVNSSRPAARLRVTRVSRPGS